MNGRPWLGWALALTASAVVAGWAQPAGALAADPCPRGLPRAAPEELDDDDDTRGLAVLDTRALIQPSERQALAGSFSILDRPLVRLVPPVDWNQDPFASEAWRSKLHSMGWMSRLLNPYVRERNRLALTRARDLMLDWVRANPPYEGFGWADKISGSRAEVLAFVLAASECARILSPAQRATLRESAIAHARFLANPVNYNPGNHGLFQDRGIVVLTGYLPTLPGAAALRAAALRRFRTQLPVSRVDAVDQEHSPGYHFLVLRVVESMLALPGRDDPALRTIALRMRRVAGWFVMPNGIITRLGDTAVKRAPAWALAQARRYRGIAPTLRSGFGIVKFGGGYLSVTAGYHPYGHKQADELTFELYDRGRPIVTDTGRYGALRDRKDPAKVAALAFTKSTQAHSTLVVDGQSYPFAEARPYGSGLFARGSGAGWWALQGRNPLLARQGVSQDRLFLYRPGQALIVVDRVRSGAQHDYARLFQFNPGISVTPGGDGRTFLLRAPRFFGSLYTAPTPGEGGAGVVVGRRDPLLGFTTSANKFVPFIPRAAVTYNTRASSADYVSVVGLTGRATATLVSSSPTRTVVRLSRPGRGAVTVTASRAGGRLRIFATS